jgi:holo-[acyl-carrier protein] synthase
MIVSVGVDLIEVGRIQRALEDPSIGKRFRERVYTEGEIRYCDSRGMGKYESYAGRFAAKEAAMKALGTGWGAKASWLAIEVVRARGGRPEIALHGHTVVTGARFTGRTKIAAKAQMPSIRPARVHRTRLRPLERAMSPQRIASNR